MEPERTEHPVNEILSTFKSAVISFCSEKNILGDRRRELGYTQAFLADYAGISASFLSELENGKETIQAGKMMDVISLLGMDICIINRGE